MSQEKVEYLSVEQGENEKAIVCIDNAVKIIADNAKVDGVGDLKLYNNGSVVAAIETIRPAKLVPSVFECVIKYDEEFEWVA